LEPSNVIYIIDSDDSIGKFLAALLAVYKMEVRAFSDVESFLLAISTVDLEQGCLLVEEQPSGLLLLRQLREQGHRLPIILLTNEAPAISRRQAQQSGATEVLQKPLINAFLMQRLTTLLPSQTLASQDTQGAVKLRDGTSIAIRMMSPADAELEQAFVRGLSNKSKRLRFFSPIKELSPQMLARFIHPSYPETYAPIATISDGAQECIIAVARYAKVETSECAEFAVVVADEWQGRGIANMLMRGLTMAAAIAGIECLEGLVLKENKGMLGLTASLGFSLLPAPGDASIVRAVKQLRQPLTGVE
tara:strand:- start:54 stop:968 length:915 start_codon:yes stop_codon:yes gene_type:complete